MRSCDRTAAQLLLGVSIAVLGGCRCGEVGRAERLNYAHNSELSL